MDIYTWSPRGNKRELLHGLLGGEHLWADTKVGQHCISKGCRAKPWRVIRKKTVYISLYVYLGNNVIVAVVCTCRDHGCALGLEV